MWWRSVGAARGSGGNPAGGGCRIRRDRATEPATAAPAGTNDPIPATDDLIRRLPPADSPPSTLTSLSAFSAEGLNLGSAAEALFARRRREAFSGNGLCGGASRSVAGHSLEEAAPVERVELDI